MPNVSTSLLIMQKISTFAQLMPNIFTYAKIMPNIFTGPCTNLLEHPDINHLDFIDLDVACFMMLIGDLSALFGIIARLAYRKVLMKDLLAFHD